ncbi:hypothetical protein SAMN04488136_13550 [Vibrio xiamenensis]|uniref:Uncharacterized protein n=1 Tax=Vibrio xiamenensis TaxID=861298 RepID=A0A1G8G9R2_9VIBR|nr:hypothetical protein [Vibrio xiamenensis]SDH91036.1 hypothetical protein SAMN04488136_13550 [Vibrio xiamenensis]
MRTYLLLAVSLMVLNGCQLTRVEGRIHDVDVKASTGTNHDHDTNGGQFCPPGQAKKGNCHY